VTPLVFEVPLPPRALSSNGQHGHWRKSATARRDYRRDVGLVAASAARSAEWPVVSGTVCVSLVFGTKGRNTRDGGYRPVDIPNAIAAFKPGFDALVDAGILVDDDARHMTLGTVRIDSKVGPAVRVTVALAAGKE